MAQAGTQAQPLRVASIGAGPTGYYAADHLLRQDRLTVEVDMVDRLPTPYGLVRLGVAPDHQKIKSVTAQFDKVAAHPRFRFFGGVEFGKDVTVADLRAHYHQIVYCTGAQTDRRMGIPGEDLRGSHPATEFVAWYNGHPDYRDSEFDLSVECAAVVGVGNVAVDVARILCRTPEELATTGPGRVHQSRDQGAGRAGGGGHRGPSRRGRARPAEPRGCRAEPGPRDAEEGGDPPGLRAAPGDGQAAQAERALSRLAGGARGRRVGPRGEAAPRPERARRHSDGGPAAAPDEPVRGAARRPRVSVGRLPWRAAAGRALQRELGRHPERQGTSARSRHQAARPGRVHGGLDQAGTDRRH